MKIQGNLHKMRSELNDPVSYYLPLGEKEVFMNELIGHPIELHFLHQINCIRCGRKTSKSFAQGYCFSCFRSAPETEECVLRPELCRAHEGFARDINYASEHCLIDHFVYLSYTSEVKVGVTRHTQIPIRWIDQGALAAIKIAQTPNRYTAGLIEVSVKSYYTDKTNWKKMLAETETRVNIEEEKRIAISRIPQELRKYATNDDTITTIKYPLKTSLGDYVSFDLDKNNLLSDILIGIKGQYLLFENGSAINVRKYSGYLIQINY